MTRTIVPLEFNCVVELVPVREKIGSVILPENRRDMNQMAETEAKLVAKGEKAFTDDGVPWAVQPEIGETVMIQKYAGQIRTADPTDLFRIVADKEIVAVLR